MKKTIEQHVENLLATVPGLEQQMMQGAANALVSSVKAQHAAEKKPMPQTVVVTEEQCRKIVREQLANVVRLMAAMLDYEASDRAPAGAGGGAVAREGGGAGKEAGVFEIAKPGATSEAGGPK